MTTTFDLGALVIHVRAGVETTIQNHMGRAIHRQFFVAIQDPLEGEGRIHPAEDEPTDRLMPYSTSGLMQIGKTTPIHGKLKVGAEAWLRVTGLTADICAKLEAFRVAPPQYIELDRTPWEIVSILWESQPWGAVSTHQTLMFTAQKLPIPTHIHLEFASPTTFRSDGMNLPVPLPHLVFNSLANRWAEITGATLRDKTLWNAFTRYHIMLNKHDTQTEMVRVKDGGKEIGFTGTAVYEFKRKNEALERENPSLEAEIQADYPNLCRVASVLADYAQFAGVGRKTTTGMGMTRRTG
jgi:CRISPR-associated endoribonuclease Cas6